MLLVASYMYRPVGKNQRISLIVLNRFFICIFYPYRLDQNTVGNLKQVGLLPFMIGRPLFLLYEDYLRTNHWMEVNVAPCYYLRNTGTLFGFWTCDPMNVERGSLCYLARAYLIWGVTLSLGLRYLNIIFFMNSLFIPEFLENAKYTINLVCLTCKLHI